MEEAESRRVLRNEPPRDSPAANTVVNDSTRFGPFFGIPAYSYSYSYSSCIAPRCYDVEEMKKIKITIKIRIKSMRKEETSG